MCLPNATIESPVISVGYCNGVELNILRNFMGNLCGYIRILPGHPWFEKDYDEIHKMSDVEIHGGLTFSRYGKSCDSHEGKDEWWIGFDCNHFDDSPSYWTIARVTEECESLAMQSIKATLQ